MESEGNVLDVLLQRHRDSEAARRLFRKLLKKQGVVPRVIVMDKLKRYQAAKGQVMPRVEHQQHKGYESSGGEFASTEPGRRTTNEAIEISRASATPSLSI